jgi:hypothetical protein
MAARFHRFRFCSASRIKAPSGWGRAGRRALVSSMSASSPVTSPSSGRSRCRARVTRIAGQLAALEIGAGGSGIALGVPYINNKHYHPHGYAHALA